jgi:hypothetical protein
MSRGTPSRMTVVTGMKGRSSSETASMAYSCAKRRAVAKAGAWVRDRGPMILKQPISVYEDDGVNRDSRTYMYISKNASST